MHFQDMFHVLLIILDRNLLANGGHLHLYNPNGHVDRNVGALNKEEAPLSLYRPLLQILFTSMSPLQCIGELYIVWWYCLGWDGPLSAGGCGGRRLGPSVHCSGPHNFPDTGLARLGNCDTGDGVSSVDTASFLLPLLPVMWT